MKTKSLLCSLCMILLLGDFFSPASSYAQHPQFRIPVIGVDSIFGMSNNFKKVRRDTVQFGIHDSATFCLDKKFMTGFQDHWFYALGGAIDTQTTKENSLPPWTPGFEVRILNARAGPCTGAASLGVGIKANIHQYTSSTQIDTFKILFQIDPTDTVSKLSFEWPAVLSEYCSGLRLTYVDANANTVDEDMLTKSKWSMPDADLAVPITSFKIIMSSPKIPPGPPAKVQLTSPVNGAINQPLTETLQWSPTTGAFYYRLQLSTDSNFASLVFNDTLRTTSKTISGLQAGTSYYWRVIVWNPYGVSFWQTPPYKFQTLSGKPASPTLLSPTNTATGVSIYPALLWQKVVDINALTYRVQVATNNTFTSIVKDTVTSDTTWLTGPLLNCVTYYWRVNATDVNGTSDWSSTFNFKTLLASPSIPALIQPADNAINQSLTPTLSWTSSDSCTSSYRLQVAKDTNFSSVVFNIYTNQTSNVLNTLEQSTIYYWRVKSLNQLDSSQFTTYRKFRTLVLPPPTPIQVSPANGDTTQNPSVTLLWRSSLYTDNYHLQIAKDQNFTLIVVDDSLLTDTTRVVNSLTNCQTYYWHIRSQNASGGSAYSAIWNFKIKPTTPTLPTLVSPGNNATGVLLTPTMSWSAGDICSYNYRLQVSKDTNFTSIVVDAYTNQISYTLSTLEQSTYYYWRVKSLNQLDSSQFTMYRKFRTLVLPPATPVQVSPTSGDTTLNTTVTFLWRSTTYTDNYHIQIATNQNFTSLVVDDSLLTDTTRLVNLLANCQTYYWHIRSKNMGGGSAYSSTWSFKIKPTTPTAPTLVSPADNATNQSFTPTLSWAAGDICSYSYRLQVATDTNFAAVIVDVYTTQTSQTLPTLLQDTYYYWKVKSLNQFDSSQFTHFKTFKTALNPPPTPVLLSPINGDTTLVPIVTLQWLTAPNASMYHVQIATDQNFNSLVLDDSTIVDTFLVTSPLTNCTLYYWHVQAKNGAGSSTFTSARTFKIKPNTPSIPTLVSPPDNVTGLTLTPTLSWTAGDICSYSYRLQVAKDSSFNIIVADVYTTQISRTIGPLELNTLHYWRVKSMNYIDSSSFSAYRKFRTLQQPPLQPVLASPVNNDTTVDPSSTLRWRVAQYAEVYHLQIATDQNFTTSSLLFNDSTLVDTFYSPSFLTNCKLYYWKVSAKNGAGKSVFSSIWNFKVKTAVPNIVTLVSPPNNQDSLSEMVRLIWNKGDLCTQQYAYQVSRDILFTNIVASGQISDTTVQVGPIAGNVYYYWRVQATNFLGGGIYSSVWQFHTTRSRPVAPALLSPPDGSTDQPSTIILQWDSTSFALVYKIQVALDAGFTSLKVNDSTILRQPGILPSKTVNGLLNSTTYYWRVGAKNEIGSSGWSGAWRFTTLFPPTAPALNMPYNGAIGISITPQFDWSIAQRANFYRLQVSEDTIFSKIVFDDSTLSILSWQITNPLKSLAKYYWHVRGKNNAGWGSWSSIFSFTTTRTGVANWLVPLTISETGPASTKIYFGVHPNATAGIDPALGEYELPPPDSWSFDARFISPLIGQGLLVDILKFNNYTQVDTFQFTFQPTPGMGSYPMKIAWPMQLVKNVCDSMIIEDQLTVPSIRARMDRDSSFTVNSLTIHSLYIVKYGTFPLPLDVKPVQPELPNGFVLYQNYPNPFNPSTHIIFSTDRSAKVQIKIYDILGREIITLADLNFFPGVHQLDWNGKNENGVAMPSGIYYIRMIAESSAGIDAGNNRFVSTRKMIMLK